MEVFIKCGFDFLGVWGVVGFVFFKVGDFIGVREKFFCCMKVKEFF